MYKITLTLLFMFLSLLLLSISFMPLSMGFWLLINTLFTAMTISYFISNWFSLCLILIYMGGLLVMFAYFLAITPNLKMPSFTLSHLILFTVSMLNMIMLQEYFSYLMNYSNSSKTKITDLMLSFNFPVLIIIIMALFITLISVVHITYRQTGTLRPFF